MADTRERGLVADVGELANFLLVDDPGLGDDGSAMDPTVTIPHLPFRIVREGEGFATLTTQGRAVNSAERPKVGFREELELVDGAFEKHLGLCTSEVGTVAVIDRQCPHGDLVDRIHPVHGVFGTLEDTVGNPDLGVGVGATGTRIVVIPDHGDLFVFVRKDADPSVLEEFSLGSHGQVFCTLLDVTHDAAVVAVDSEHEALLAIDLRDPANNKVGNLHKSSNPFSTIL